MTKDIENLKRLYDIVNSHPKNCKLTDKQKREVTEYQRQLSAHTSYPVRTSICNRHPSIRQGQRILEAHGKL